VIQPVESRKLRRVGNGMAEKTQRGGDRGGLQPDDGASGLVSLAEITEAARLLASVVIRTPLLPIPMLSPDLLVKPESLQPTGSFKLRGAYAAISASGRSDGASRSRYGRDFR